MRRRVFRTVEQGVVEQPERTSTGNEQTHATERGLGVASRSSCAAEPIPLRQYAAPSDRMCLPLVYAYFGPCFCALWRVFCMFSHICLGSPILAACGSVEGVWRVLCVVADGDGGSSDVAVVG